jgi:REP element-mobilizing transposase RayT
MANTYTSLHYHVVFSTKNRQPFLGEAIRERTFAYLGGIARESGATALEIGGMADHVHFSFQFLLLLRYRKPFNSLKAAPHIGLRKHFRTYLILPGRMDTQLSR